MQNRLAYLLVILLLVGCGSPQHNQVTALDDSFVSTMELNTNWFYRLQPNSDPVNRLPYIPVQVDNRIFAVNGKGRIHEFSAVSGDMLSYWDLSESVSSGVASDGELLFVGTNNAEFIAMSVSGEEVWRAKLTSRLLSQPAFSGSLIVLLLQDGYLVALNRDTGKQIWVYDSSNPRLTLFGDASPIAVRDQIIASFASGKIQSFDVNTGNLLWSHDLGRAKGATDLKRINDADATPVLINQNLVFGHSQNDKILLISLDDGRVVNTYNYGTLKSVIPSSDVIIIFSNDDELLGIHPKTGDLIWQNDQFKYRKLTQGTIWQNQLVFGDSEGWLHLVDPLTGKILARTQPDHIGIAGKPLALEDQLIVQGESGALKSYSMSGH